MSKPASILKKKQEQKLAADRFNESVTGWHQPTDLDLLPARPSYSPVRTPPKLRTYVTILKKSFLFPKLFIKHFSLIKKKKLLLFSFSFLDSSHRLASNHIEIRSISDNSIVHCQHLTIGSTYFIAKTTEIENNLSLFSTPPAGLDTWGLDPIDYRLNQDLHLIRRYPSPLTHFGLSSRSQKQKKVLSA